ncbi:MAG: bifunctional alpha,alpha-trehalose-phosphate synthase (UDP-forming)/trehalose-phosphatase [Myxococcota bacterium]|nr:bifunctional alpha,alpha-trehalose-phosphate synthase (UDP-forming)/trehalose-phosphatase [Myxococcota bacterium]
MARTRRRKNGSGPLVVASNRLPYTFQRTAGALERRPSSGGLVSALEPALRKRGGVWIGWPGIEVRRNERISTEASGYEIEPVLLSDGEVQRFYHGFSNRTLWPLCHSFPALTQFERRDWTEYESVNERFAEAMAEHAEASGLVWVHDYHLMLTPGMLRAQRPDVRIGFFLHIPFPPYDIFRLCPWDRELLRGLLAADVIGFHVPGYAQNFLDCCERRLGLRVDRDTLAVEHGDRAVKIGAYPIGIEFDSFAETANASNGTANGDKGAERIVLGVDRLDYTKGIPERIRAFERLLELHPRHREKVVLLQLAVPSRSQVAEYRDLKREIDELVGRINGRFATASWSPIRYLYRSVPRARLCALYRDADVALVTPLRDGMNLVAKEFAACQVSDPGVLILSRMAGAAETMREALQVNPFDLDETAHVIHRALTMDEDERASRMASMRRRERRDDVDSWVQTFLDAADEPSAALGALSKDDVERWLRPFIKQYPLCLFLDYDGTLTPIVDHPSKAKLQPAMRKALEACSRRKDTDVSIVSGRALGDVRKLVGDERLMYAGNHGLEIEGPGIHPFRHQDLGHYASRTAALAQELEAVSSDGAWTEAKGPTLTFHYRGVPQAKRPKMIDEVVEIMSRAGYQARHAHAAVEARPPIGWDKGRAVLHLLRERYGPNWSESVRVIYVGDDLTDEDAFRFLAGLALTFRVGSAEAPTAALHRLSDVPAVQTLLEWIGSRPKISA